MGARSEPPASEVKRLALADGRLCGLVFFCSTQTAQRSLRAGAVTTRWVIPTKILLEELINLFAPHEQSRLLPELQCA